MQPQDPMNIEDHYRLQLQPQDSMDIEIIG